MVNVRQHLWFHCAVVAIALCMPWTASGADTAAVRLSVTEAVSLALERNLGLRLERLGLTSAVADVTSAEGVFDTTLGVEISLSDSEFESSTQLLGSGTIEEKRYDWAASATRLYPTGTLLEISWENERFDTNTPFASLNPSYTSGIGLQVTQPLLEGRGSAVQTAEREAARREAEAVREGVDDTIAALVADVKKAYWELVFSRKNLEVLKLSLTLAETLRDETREKINAGVLAPVEIYQTEAEVARREELLLAGERIAGNAEDALKLLINTDDWNVSVETTDKPDLAYEPVSFEAVLERALSQRPDIRAADRRAEGAKILQAAAKNTLLPTLAVTGGVGASGLGGTYGDALGDFTGETFYSWNVGLSLELPLENRAARGAFHRARAEAESADIAAALLRQEVTRAVRDAVRGVNVAAKTVSATKKSSLAFRKRLEAEQSKFQVGLSTANDVLEAQEAYARALSAEHRAGIDYARARADLDRVQGIITVTPSP